MNPITGPDPNPVLVRYFAGQESLETAATELAQIFKESMRARELGQPPTLRDFTTEPALHAHQGGNAYSLMEADLPKLRALMERVEAKLDLINTGGSRISQ
jgi:hypothetical protein